MIKFLPIIRHYKKLFLGKIFDLLYSVETTKAITEDKLGFKKPNYYPYVPTEIESFSKIMNKLNINSNDVFCDIGCGKGRTLLLAKKYSFKKIIGTDLSKDLITIAQKNIKNDKKISIVCEDSSIADFCDNITFLYMYLSFNGPSFQSFLIKVKESLERKPRNIIFLYGFPIEHQMVLKSGLFTELALPIKRYQNSYKLYQTSLLSDPEVIKDKFTN